MSEHETPAGEEPVTEKNEATTESPKTKKSKPAKKASPKKAVSKMAKLAPKKSAKERKEIAKKASPKKAKKTGTPRNVEVEIGGKKVEWPRKKAGVLLALKTLKSTSTKLDIAGELKKMDMNDGDVNKFCKELEKQKFVELSDIEGDRNIYRQITAKGKEVKLPKLYI